MSPRPIEEGGEGARVVAEEQELLRRVLDLLHSLVATGVEPSPGAAYDADLVELRDILAEAKPEDQAALVEQMARVAALQASRQRPTRAPLDPSSPYFAHIRLRDTSALRPIARDVLIGRRGLIDRAAGVQIVDWRDAPVSQIYYRYDEGDDYDERIDDRRLKGVLETRRNLAILDGALRRIGCPLGVFVPGPGGRWFEADGQASPALAGGQGKAARPPRPSPRRDRRRPSLGVHGGEVARADKHLPEIAALIDRHQFDLITQPSSGLIVIQGGAGSGKTTVALHRIAYLLFHEPQRFRPSRCLFVVPSLALERYVSGVLPALDVRGVPVVTLKAWMQATRRKVVPEAGQRYTEETPPAVARIKKHPAMLAIVDRFVDDRTAEAFGELLGAVAGEEGRTRLRDLWGSLDHLPPLDRLTSLRRQLDGIGLSPTDLRRAEFVAVHARRRVRDPATLWSELLTDGERLRGALPSGGPEGVLDGEIAELIAWTSAQQDDSVEVELEGIDPELRTPIDGGELDDSLRGRAAGRLDIEDDAILLRLAQRLRGGLHRRTATAGHGDNRAISYDHVAIDEAQDLSLLDIKILVDAVEPRATGDGPRRSVTLAGDVAQRIVFDNGFVSWSETLRAVGEPWTEVSPLRLSYRSTAEVMRLARAVLGPLAGEEHPARPGEPVESHRFASVGQAVAFLGEALRSLAVREPTASVALISRHPAQADAWFRALQRVEVPRLRLVRDQDFLFSPGIDVTDVVQVKGLEFDYVVLLDASDASYPDSLESRHLLHIGATRAAHQLWLTCIGARSPLLPAWLDDPPAPATPDPDGDDGPPP